jgi:hypothetical protein
MTTTVKYTAAKERSCGQCGGKPPFFFICALVDVLRLPSPVATLPLFTCLLFLTVFTTVINLVVYETILATPMKSNPTGIVPLGLTNVGTGTLISFHPLGPTYAVSKNTI